MLLVAKKRPRITGLSKVIAVVTFHVYRNPAQVATLDERSHASRHVTELVVMSYGQLESLLIGECHKYLGLFCVECEWFLHIDVASLFQAKPRNIEMAFRRCRDVNNVWAGVTQKFSQVAVIPFDREPLVELPCHQHLSVTDPNDLASLDPLDLGRVSIGDLAASHNGDSKHVGLSPGSSGNNASTPPSSAPLASRAAGRETDMLRVAIVGCGKIAD